MAATTDNYKVCLARVGFIESARRKIRPIIIVSEPKGKYDLFMSIPVSSGSKMEDVDVRLKDRESAGLIQPSIAMVHRMAAIAGQDILEEIGQLSTPDQTTIKKSLRQLLNL